MSANISEVAAQTDRFISPNGELLSFADRGLSLFGAQTMKDFENQITDLKKENFNLKLRIYFLEEQVKQRFDGANEDIYKTNIELKVEVESLKHHLQEKHNLLIKASNAVESLTGDSGFAVLRVRADAEKQVKVEEFMNSKIIQLKEDLKVAQKNVEIVSLLLEEEKILRMRVEQKQLQMTFEDEEKMDATHPIEKNKTKEHLSIALNSKDQAGLSDQTSVDDKIKELKACLCRKDRKIESLQLQLKIKAKELDEEKKNSFKRDKTIQGLTLNLRTKEKELNANIDYDEHLANSELMNSLKRTDRNLEMELGEICLLRKHLEENTQAYQELRQNLEENLEEKNKLGKSRDDDTFSLFWDQTAYLSICLNEKDPSNFEMENLSLVELRKKVRQLLLVVQELQSQISAENSKPCKHCAATFGAEEKDHFSKDMGIPSVYFREVWQHLVMNEQTELQSVEFADKSLEREIMTKREQELTSAIILSDQSGNIFLKSRFDQSNMADDSGAKNCYDFSKTIFYEDLKNIFVRLRNEHDHFSIENKILKQDVGVQNSRSVFPHFAPEPIPLAVSTFNMEANCIILAGEEDQHVKDEWTSKKISLIGDGVLIAAKVLNPTNVAQKSFKKSRLPIPLKSSKNSRSQNLTKIIMDRPDKVNEKQKMHLEEKTEVNNVADIVNESLAKEKVHLTEKQIENDNLRELLSKKIYVCDHLQNEYEHVQKENEKLCKKLDKRNEEMKQLIQELSNTRNEFKRLQRELKVQQHLLSDDNEVLQSLKAELEVFKRMSKANETETDLIDSEHRSSLHSSQSLVISSNTVPKIVPGFQMWADKNGCHVLGVNEDHCLLHKHISEIWKLLSQTKSLLEDIGSKQHSLSGSKVPDQRSLKSVGTNVRRAQKRLEEVACLSRLFWRVTLPRTVIDDSTNMDEMKIEIIRLRNALSHHQKKLHSTMKQLQSANLIKENMEKIIINQLALTHDVLKKARGNLES